MKEPRTFHLALYSLLPPPLKKIEKNNPLLSKTNQNKINHAFGRQLSSLESKILPPKIQNQALHHFEGGGKCIISDDPDVFWKRNVLLEGAPSLRK